MFKDRKDAGKKLALALHHYKDKNVLVLAIPRGGVEVGYEVACSLNAEFSLIIVRKLPFPMTPEAGFGAVAEDGTLYLTNDTLSDATINRVKKEQEAEIRRRVQVLRHGEPLPDMRKRTVILVDDGIAVGSTMKAAIELCRNKRAGKIVVAVPVSGHLIANELRELVDEVIVLEMPLFFYAVAQVYKRWYDVADQEVLSIMNRWLEELKVRGGAK